MNKKIEDKMREFCNREGLSWENDYARDSFLEGAKIAEKEYKKTIRDKYNYLNSELKQENKMKFTKVINQERVKELEIQTKLLRELL
jgi:hypothetical protein